MGSIQLLYLYLLQKKWLKHPLKKKISYHVIAYTYIKKYSSHEFQGFQTQRTLSDQMLRVYRGSVRVRAGKEREIQNEQVGTGQWDRDQSSREL